MPPSASGTVSQPQPLQSCCLRRGLRVRQRSPRRFAIPRAASGTSIRWISAVPASTVRYASRTPPVHRRPRRPTRRTFVVTCTLSRPTLSAPAMRLAHLERVRRGTERIDELEPPFGVSVVGRSPAGIHHIAVRVEPSTNHSARRRKNSRWMPRKANAFKRLDRRPHREVDDDERIVEHLDVGRVAGVGLQPPHEAGCLISGTS